MAGRMGAGRAGHRGGERTTIIPVIIDADSDPICAEGTANWSWTRGRMMARHWPDERWDLARTSVT